jgi:predicted cupin superfamily sugar epimerase
MRLTTIQVIEHFEMTTLPVESTYFVKTYRSKTSRPDGTPDGSAIIALYSDDPRSCSLFHRLKYEEVWHFYAGDPIRLVLRFLQMCGRPEKSLKVGSGDYLVAPCPLVLQEKYLKVDTIQI